MQSKKKSLLESCTNTAAGLVLAILANAFFIFPMIEWHLAGGGSLKDIFPQAVATIFMTILSIARGYILRRLFNRGAK